jgi:hypothetical protein
MKTGIAVAVLSIGLAVPAPVWAYTLVLRSGERVEIGESYRLDGSHLEFVYGEVVRRLDLQRVDLAATARANGETVSAFVARATRTVARARQVEAAPVDGALTVTNADLEPYRQERERLDAERAAREPRAADPEVEPVADRAPEPGLSRDELEEWRTGYLALQDRVDAQQAQIDDIRASLAYRESRPFRYGLSYRYNFGRGPIRYLNGGYYSYYNPPYPYLRADEEFAQLNSRLIDIEIEQRATVLERDRYVERARRAGVPPGWLRE